MKPNKYSNVLYAIGLLIMLVCLCLFYIFWLSSDRIDSTLGLNADSHKYIIDRLSVSITVLEAFIGVIGLFFAVLAIFGYQQIKESAHEIARKESVRLFSENREKFKIQIKQEIQQEELLDNILKKPTKENDLSPPKTTETEDETDD